MLFVGIQTYFFPINRLRSFSSRSQSGNWFHWNTGSHFRIEVSVSFFWKFRLFNHWIVSFALFNGTKMGKLAEVAYLYDSSWYSKLTLFKNTRHIFSIKFSIDSFVFVDNYWYLKSCVLFCSVQTCFSSKLMTGFLTSKARPSAFYV